MIRTHSLSFPNLGSTDSIKQGTLKLRKGKAMMAMRVKFGVPIANSSGGGLALASADKLALLNHWTLDLKYGASQQNPYKTLSLKTLRLLANYLLGTELEGYTDTSTGWGKTIANGATNTVYIYMLIPTGALWMISELRNAFCMGRSQSATSSWEFVRASSAPSLTSGLAISGTPTMDCYPFEVSVRGDRWAYLPEYRENTIRDFFHEYDQLLPLAVWERTAAHASTSLTKINLWIGDEEIHKDVSPADFITEYNDNPTLPSEATVTDRFTQLYALANNLKARELPTGKVRVEQPNKDLADFLPAYLGFVNVKQSDRDMDLVDVSNNVRKKTVKAVSIRRLDGLVVPERLHAVMPFRIVDNDDAEFPLINGAGVAYGGKTVESYLPTENIANAKAALAKAPTEAAKRAVLRNFAADVPGAATGPNGVDPGSPVFQAIAKQVA